METTSNVVDNRLNALPNPAFAGLGSALWERMNRLGADIHTAQFAQLLDPDLQRVFLQGFQEAGAHEGTVWLADATGEFLEPVFNNGPDAGRIVGHFKQPLRAGLLSMVFASEQPFVENDVSRNAQQSRLLDTQLGVQTHALIAVPFHFLNACRGVVSCVQLRRAETPATALPGFQPAHLAAIQRSAALAAQLIEHRLLSQTGNCTRE